MFSEQEFTAPGAEYRSAPFWSWNTRIEPAALEKQIQMFQKMGMGGFHIHPRTGLDTPYLGEDYWKAVDTSIRLAKENGLLVCLYDEDRWPSGAAGGLALTKPEYRARELIFTAVPYENWKKERQTYFSVTYFRTNEGRLLAAYDVKLDENGILCDYRAAELRDAPARGWQRFYAYSEPALDSPWFNGKCYIDLMNRNAVESFLQVTHQQYWQRFGKDFGGVIPSIFTDEPQLAFPRIHCTGNAGEDSILPWTEDFDDTFRHTYGTGVLEVLPEIIFETAQSKSRRWQYREHVMQRFMEGFAEPYRAWCRAHGIAMTGHMVSDGDIEMQTESVGDVMRFYDVEEIPGIDILYNDTCIDAAKQAQSVAHQNGKNRMVAEAFGVTNWDFDFRGRLYQGNWAAACGVNWQAPHLTMMTMEGEGKRDYPASIGYQAPWWKKYRLLEDHFARLNYALTRGEPEVHVAVIDPVESCWLYYGDAEKTAEIRRTINRQFHEMIEWLLFGGIDFDFLNEALLPRQLGPGGAVGKMQYDAVLVANCRELRPETLRALETMQQGGVRMVFAGDLPQYACGMPCQTPALCRVEPCVPFTREAVLDALSENRVLSLTEKDGLAADDVLYTLRRDDGGRWLYLAPGKMPQNPDQPRKRSLTVKIKGSWQCEMYDTFTGKHAPCRVSVCGGRTEWQAELWDFGSLLYRLAPADGRQSEPAQQDSALRAMRQAEKLPGSLAYTLSEPNVLLLDTAVYRADNGEAGKQELLRADNAIRRRSGMPERRDVWKQPWAVQEAENTRHKVFLSMTIDSRVDVETVHLALENAANTTLKWNGQAVACCPDGWYVDEKIACVPLPGLRCGENLLEIETMIDAKAGLEWYYLLGDFGVEVRGSQKTIVPLPARVGFGDLAPQGFPFYGGNFTYHIPLCCEKASQLWAGQYRGALLEVQADGKPAAEIIAPPYTAKLPPVQNQISLKLYGTRFNTFGALHQSDATRIYASEPNAWRTEGTAWAPEYQLHPFGVMTAPEWCENPEE